MRLCRIDVSNNLLDDFNEITHLSQLTRLEEVSVEGNAFSFRENYRLHVFTKFLHGSVLSGRELPVLDGESVTEQEAYAMRGIMFKPSYSSAEHVSPLASPPPLKGRLLSVAAQSSPTFEDLLRSVPLASAAENVSGANLSVVELDRRFNDAIALWASSMQRGPNGDIAQGGASVLQESAPARAPQRLAGQCP